MGNYFLSIDCEVWFLGIFAEEKFFECYCIILMTSCANESNDRAGTRVLLLKT